MTASETAEKDGFLASIKAEGRSSPAGMHWQAFYEFLLRSGEPSASKPPAPLILAASGASDDAKHRRLAEQLDWAIRHGVFKDAVEFLKTIPTEHWNLNSPAQWYTAYSGESGHPVRRKVATGSDSIRPVSPKESGR